MNSAISEKAESSEDNGAVVVLVTCPDEASAQRISSTLVQNRLAACVNQFPCVVSTYVWEGSVTTSTEIQLLIKTTRVCLAKLEQLVLAEHPYNVPEFVVLRVDHASANYLQWMRQSTHT